MGLLGCTIFRHDDRGTCETSGGGGPLPGGETWLQHVQFALLERCNRDKDKHVQHPKGVSSPHGGAQRRRQGERHIRAHTLELVKINLDIQLLESTMHYRLQYTAFRRFIVF